MDCRTSFSVVGAFIRYRAVGDAVFIFLRYLFEFYRGTRLNVCGEWFLEFFLKKY